MQFLITLSFGISGLTVLFFVASLILFIVDDFCFKRKIKKTIETGRIKYLPEYKQVELTSKL